MAGTRVRDSGFGKESASANGCDVRWERKQLGMMREFWPDSDLGFP